MLHSIIHSVTLLNLCNDRVTILTILITFFYTLQHCLTLANNRDLFGAPVKFTRHNTAQSPLLPTALYYSPDSFHGFAFPVTDDVVLLMLIIIHEVHRFYSFCIDCRVKYINKIRLRCFIWRLFTRRSSFILCAVNMILT